MGFLEVLTIVLVILKATGHLDWSWWQVFIPEYISAGIVLLAIGGAALGFFSLSRR